MDNYCTTNLKKSGPDKGYLTNSIRNQGSYDLVAYDEYNKTSGHVSVNRSSSSLSSIRRQKYSIEAAENETAKRFYEFARLWKENKVRFSTMLQKVEDDNYLSIIGMGESALPFIFRELASEPDHWFVALKYITRHMRKPEEIVVSRKHRGNIDLMTKDWLEWAKNNGFIVD